MPQSIKPESTPVHLVCTQTHPIYHLNRTRGRCTAPRMMSPSPPIDHMCVFHHLMKDVLNLLASFFLFFNYPM